MTPEEIKYRLACKKTSQTSLAKRWRVSGVTVHYLIHRKLRSRDLERRLARVLGVKVSTLRNGLST
jgi:hypothetical protein